LAIFYKPIWSPWFILIHTILCTGFWKYKSSSITLICKDQSARNSFLNNLPRFLLSYKSWKGIFFPIREQSFLLRHPKAKKITLSEEGFLQTEIFWNDSWIKLWIRWNLWQKRVWFVVKEMPSFPKSQFLAKNISYSDKAPVLQKYKYYDEHKMINTYYRI
jgi:hypothetical protein